MMKSESKTVKKDGQDENINDSEDEISAIEMGCHVSGVELEEVAPARKSAPTTRPANGTVQPAMRTGKDAKAGSSGDWSWLTCICAILSIALIAYAIVFWAPTEVPVGELTTPVPVSQVQVKETMTTASTPSPSGTADQNCTDHQTFSTLETESPSQATKTALKAPSMNWLSSLMRMLQCYRFTTGRNVECEDKSVRFFSH